MPERLENGAAVYVHGDPAHPALMGSIVVDLADGDYMVRFSTGSVERVWGGSIERVADNA